MPRDDEQLVLAGTHLTEKDAEQLKEAVRANPSDLDSCLRLLGYLMLHSRGDPSLEALHLESVLWLIENQPDSDITGSPFCQIFVNSVDYPRACEAWEKAISRTGRPPIVLLNAARFFALTDRNRSRALLEQGEREAPSWGTWASSLGHSFSLDVSIGFHAPVPGSKAQLTDEERRQTAEQALGHFERALRLAQTPQRRFSELPDCAEAAMECERFSAATRYADEIIALAPQCSEDRHRPDTLHTAHIIRGRAAIVAGDFDAACTELAAAGEQGSMNAPVLRSFGPDFRLASLLLEADRTEAVLGYLDRCAQFWKPKRIAKWRAQIERGERPAMSRGFDPDEMER